MAILRRLIHLFTLLVLVAALFGLGLFFDYHRFLETPLVKADSPKVLTIESGDTLTTAIKTLTNNGMQLAEKSPLPTTLGPYYFRYLASINHRANQLKIGDYLLHEDMTAPDVLALITSGRTIEHKVQFLEGWTFKQFRQQLEKNAEIEPTLQYVPDHELLATLGETDITHPEGLFFPDTYQFAQKTKDISIYKRAFALMQKNLAEAWEQRDKSIQLKSPYELLILASIIEKETYLDSERHQISGVFHRRLAKDMLLQTDPTVIYGLGDQYNGTIYKRDLRTDTPYNTYTRKGLPPTPIALPGKASLIAAGQPDKGKSLFFVANGTGGHTFSDTYKKHLKAVKQFRQRQKKKQQ